MEAGRDGLFVVEGPVVDRAEPTDDAESCTRELPNPAPAALRARERPDLLVPPSGSGMRGWLLRLGGALTRSAPGLALTALVAAVPTQFFVGRIDDTMIAVPVLYDVLGGVGLVLLPLMWLAYFAVAALPMLIFLAGAVGLVLPRSADGRRPGLRTVWSLVAYRLRTLWLWVALLGLVAQALPVVLDADQLDPAIRIPLIIALTVAATGALTVAGLLGCVVLIEHGRGPRRALHLLSITPTAGLVSGALLYVIVPRLAGQALGSIGGTAASVVTGVLWAVAALVTYAQARRAEGPVTSGSLRAELAAPDLF